MNFVTDTHALLWWFTDDVRLSPKAQEIFNKCESGENLIFIPSITLAEAISIFDKKRVVFDFRRLFKKIEDSANFVITPLDAPILRKMLTLRNIPELHDKIIVATAKHLAIPLITKDQTIHDLLPVLAIW